MRGKSVKPACDAQIGSGTRDAVLDSGAVELQHHRHDHGIRRAVMGVVDRPHRVADAVNRAQTFLEGHFVNGLRYGFGAACRAYDDWW